MFNICIIGGGKFGQKAAKNLNKKYPEADITIVDKKKIEEKNKSFNYIQKDGIIYLAELLDKNKVPEWIIPAVPIHLAFEWIKYKINKKIEIIPISKSICKDIKFSIIGKQGELYTSHADFICPDNCPEPSNICSVTKQKRISNLYDFLKSIKYLNYKSIVIQSHQLCPGTGGYSPESLYNSLEIIKKSKNPIFLSTSCRCHGVTHCFQIG